MGVVTTALYLYSSTVCMGTVFGPVNGKPDKWAGGDALLLKRPVKETDHGIAHRTLPLGKRVRVSSIRHPKKRIWVRVIDRGPYGAMHEGKWLIKRKRSDPGKWRGCVDLTAATARAIGHNMGRQKVKIEWKSVSRN